MNYSKAVQKAKKCRHAIVVSKDNPPKAYSDSRLLCRIKVRDGWRSDVCNHNCPLSE